MDAISIFFACKAKIFMPISCANYAPLRIQKKNSPNIVLEKQRLEVGNACVCTVASTPSTTTANVVIAPSTPSYANRHAGKWHVGIRPPSESVTQQSQENTSHKYHPLQIKGHSQVMGGYKVSKVMALLSLLSLHPPRHLMQTGTLGNDMSA